MVAAMEDAVVVGGGIAGLTAARVLSGDGLSVTVLDANGWTGGRLRTLHIDGVAVDVGGSFFQDFYPHTLRIIHDMQLSDMIENFPLKAGVMRSGRLRPVWPAADLLTGQLLSIPSLARLGLGIAFSLIPAWRVLDPDNLLAAVKYDDETVETWSTRVLGEEATNFFIAPLLRGVVHWNAETTSRAVSYTILKASLKYRKAYHLADGMSSLCDRMAAGVKFRAGARVVSVRRRDAHWDVQFESDGALDVLQTRRVVCAVPADQVCNLIPELDAEEQEFFRAISYSSTAVAVLETASDRQGVRPSVFFNAQDEPVVEGVTPSYSLGPSGSRFVRISISTAAFRANEQLSDADLGNFILSAARHIPYLDSWFDGARIAGVVRWPQALPIFDVGHLKRILSWQERSPQFDSLAFAGDYLSGPYIEGAVRSGLRAASYLLEGTG